MSHALRALALRAAGRLRRLLAPQTGLLAAFGGYWPEDGLLTTEAAEGHGYAGSGG